MMSLLPRFLFLLLLFLVNPANLLAAEEVPVSAEAWSLETTAGDTLTFPYEHDEPVILLFWASWCPYCKALMPHLQSMLDEYGDDSLTIYAIAFRDDGEPMEYLYSQGYGFVSLPNGDAVAEAYGVYGTPGLLIFSADNKRVFNLYDIEAPEAEHAAELNHTQKAARKAPFWAAKIRLALDELSSP
jgi:cytochrome c biogenesis protein CcmG/thiol:disulfide interchange protein DsbE